MFDLDKLASSQEGFEYDDRRNGERISGIRKISSVKKAVYLSEEDKLELKELFHRAEFDPYSAESALKKVTKLLKSAKSSAEKKAVLKETLEKVFRLAEVIEGQFEKDSLLQRESRSGFFVARNDFIRFFNAEILTEIDQLDQYYRNKSQKILTKFVSGSLSTMSDHEIRRFLHREEHSSGLQRLLASYYEQIIIDGHLEPTQEKDFSQLISLLYRHDSPEKGKSFDLLDNKLTRLMGIPAQPDLTKNKWLSKKAIESTLRNDGFEASEAIHAAEQVLTYIAKLQ